ncbi:MAG: acyl-CoA dehydrogenase family protein [Chloroflexota bacterium]|nr:acyl-CoA/acyl-ACP dehydrogenase [Dehalococcoidia bacterium]MDW8254933.1 acyl-CoA dehydrogenase family protein [Chloroflexota bacterium]
MELGPSETQQVLKRTAREFLQTVVNPAIVRQMEEDRIGFDPAVWKKICELGWTGLMIPEEYGGQGGDVSDMAILFEEVGRSLLPSPLFASGVEAALTILTLGSEEQKRELLPKLASGEKIFVLALTEPSGTYDGWGVETRAERTGSGWTLTGTKLYISYAHVADLLIVAARTGEGDDGIAFFLVDPKVSGVKLTILDTIGKDHQYIVELNGAEAESLLGPERGAWHPFQDVLAKAAVVHSAASIGAAERCLELAVDYSKQRIQFGRPIGSFQALQHKMARVVTEITGAQLCVYEAAYKLAVGQDARLEVAIAKAAASEAYTNASIEGCHIHGGAGFIRGSEMELYFRKAKGAEVILGHPRWHKKRVTALLAEMAQPAEHH